ncbi:MAG: undecaprenyldiphospho-muramoylpentapeptide beta-N-acetylglucosaminyltransferase [Bacteroidales bacterium]|nr:undecaprenyldiphospho-muramoylpentapeptide beta-N-acetylglucosaminyltransferase [Bacteroidales bacterium]
MKKIIISGGGTGGHVFPAIAIANALRAKMEDLEILFIGAKGRMEMEKVPAAGYHIEGLTVSGFQRRWTLKNLTFPFKLMASMLKARSLIGHFKPDAVVGVGGYASGPTLRIATDKGIPTLIQEQNSFPGMTNRLLSKKVQKICVAYSGMEKYFPKNKIILTGNPIRQDLIHLQGMEREARKHFGLQEDVPVVLVMGGSGGAGTINQAMLELVKELEKPNDRSPIQILWQTGKYYYKSIQVQLKDTKKGILVAVPFIDRMDLAYAAASLIVSRAGAIAISELCVVAKPCILIPSPNVAEDHQMKNARSLVDQQAALLVRDQEAIEKLSSVIFQVMGNQELQQSLAGHIKPLGIVNAADKIADEIITLIKLSNPSS